MATARRAPRLAGVRWRSVRGGLTLLVVTWSLLTALAVLTRGWSIGAAASASGEEQQAAAAVTFALFGLVYQLAYVLLAALLSAAAVRVTRAPAESGAVTPALISAVGFAALALAVLTVLSASTTPAEERQLSEAAVSGFWIAAVVLRTLAVLACSVALQRLARHLQRAFSGAWLGALFGLLLIDAAASLHGLLAPGSLAATASAARWGLIGIQLAFAVLLVGSAWRVRRLVRPLAAEEKDEPLPEQAEPEASEPSAPTATRAPFEPDISPGGRALAAFLLAVGVAALPLWDAVDPRIRFELDAPTPLMSGGLALAGLLAGLVLHGVLASDAYRARLVFVGATLLGVGYAAMTLYTTALTRSRFVDRLPVCESGGRPEGEALSRPMLSPIEGPRLESGVPCTRASERRVHHLEEHPKGELRDGLAQIVRRFAGDRPRALGGTAACLLALVLSGLLVFRAAGPEDSPEAEGGDGAERRQGGEAQVRE